MRIVEVGPRDGLQNEAARIPTGAKITLVDQLSAAGHAAIEVAAFVSPAWVPQMADAADVFAGVTRRPGTRYSALVPNRRGFERALAARVDEIAIVVATTETFSMRNINQTIAGSLATYADVCDAARAAGLRVRGYLSTCFGCPFEGPVSPSTVAGLSARLLDIGVYEVAISDTIGIAHPAQVSEVLDRVADRIPLPRVALHFHDTRGTALVNVLAGLMGGVRTFDASAGGLGGCPYAPGASGNLATEDLLYMLNGLGIETGVSLEGVMTASQGIEPLLDHPLPSRVVRALTRSS